MPLIPLSDLRAKSLARLDGNSTLYTMPEVDFVINEAIATVSLFTGFYRATVSIPGFSVAGRLVYSTPDGLLAPGIVSFEGRTLQKISLKKLARMRRTWATDTTASRGRVEFWAPIGNGQFVISPKDAQGGCDIAVTGMATPPKLVQPEDVMPLENEYVDIITEYCAHRMPLKIGGKLFADGSLALNDFYAAMKARKRYEGIKLPRYRLLDPKKEVAA